MDREPSSRPGVIALAPHGRDAEALEHVLGARGVPLTLCEDPSELESVLAHHPGVLILTQEALTNDVVEIVSTYVQGEPSWSNLPILLLVNGMERPPLWRTATLVRRPVTQEQLIALIRLALDSRARQYAIRSLLAALDAERAQLEDRVMDRTRELRNVHERLAERREQDRLRMARDLHDDTVQRLLFLHMSMSHRADASLPDGARAQLDGWRGDILDTVHSLRRLLRELRPSGLELGLAPAIERLVEDLADTIEAGSPTIDVHATLDDTVEPDIALCAYRAVQELVRNSLKHADATRIDVHLVQRDPRLSVTVEDDGNGFTPPETFTALALDDHFGLVGVEEHVNSLGGDLTLEAVPGKGTRVQVDLPMALSKS